MWVLNGGAPSSSSSSSAVGPSPSRGEAVRFMPGTIPSREMGEEAESSGVVEGVTDLAGEEFRRTSFPAEEGWVLFREKECPYL